MDLLKTRLINFVILSALVIASAFPVAVSAQDYKVFTSDEYGFSMKYPSSWIKIDKPKGNYYVVFQSPDLVENFRSRIHVAAHSPVKDSISVFAQELKSGITDMQKKAKEAGSDKPPVTILDEGEFKCEVPGSQYFFIQAYDENSKIWMDIVIVFYKTENTLLRISCLAPSSAMESYQKTFNEVLLSVKFASSGSTTQIDRSVPAASTPPGRPAPQPAQPGQQQLLPPQPSVPSQLRPQTQPEATPAQPQSRTITPASRIEQPSSPSQTSPSVQTSPQSGQTSPGDTGSRPVPRGPMRDSDRPTTGIIN
jgi:hypothetical protein